MSTLKVDTIQHSGGTTGLTIDSSGRILTPARPMFFARMNSLTSADSVVKFDDIQINVGSCYDSSTGRFTASVTGFYWYGFNVLSDNDGTDSYGSVSIRKNGTIYATSQFRTELDNDFNGLVTGIISLSSGDYIDCHTSLKAYGENSSNRVHTHGGAYLIG
mgnify:FL=1|tara:strand:+ start:408 stop:890 length:483 start_codon:yes stop_codon:yes gene_type:complete